MTGTAHSGVTIKSDDKANRADSGVRLRAANTSIIGMHVAKVSTTERTSADLVRMSGGKRIDTAKIRKAPK